MAERALSRRDALDHFLSLVEGRWRREFKSAADKRPAVLDHRLTGDDWDVIAMMVRLLEPFKVATLQLQGDGRKEFQATSGGFDQYFPTIELLLDHLEEAKKGIIYEEDENHGIVAHDLFEGIDASAVRFAKIYISLGWKKLTEYYAKFDNAAYVAAVLFNPGMKWQHLEQAWELLPHQDQVDYKRKYTKTIKDLWQRNYRDRELQDGRDGVEKPQIDHFRERRLAARRESSQPSAPVARQRQGRRQLQPSPSRSASDELEDYLATPRITSPIYYNDPIGWWRDVGSKEYPRLSYMAVDILTIPSSAASTERSFSSAGKMIHSRPRLERSTIAMAQCLRDWAKAGIYTPRIPLHKLNTEDLLEEG